MLTAVLIGAALMGVSGLVALAAPGGARARDLCFTALMVAGGAVGLAGAAGALVQGMQVDLLAAWTLPVGRVWLRLDALSAAFLMPVFLVPALGAVYAAGGKGGYWREGHGAGAAALRVFFGVLAGAMAVVVVARDGVLFLVAWEVMALAAFFAVSTEHRRAEVRRAAWTYLVAAHAGTLALIAMLAVLRTVTGTFDLEVIPPEAGAPATVFLLAVLGFGLKAGIMPLHVWLPGAHANAPSHVSAVLSGVMLKMGVYGVLRVVSLAPGAPAWWGWLLVGLGAGSGIAGAAYAVAQGDLKRLLAYSSVENVGVIMLGIGAGLVGRATGDPALAGLATAGAVMHVWNHAMFKPLLFMGAGSVLHATGTRRMGLLGGLGKVMPWTAWGACIGSVAIGALPPLNGFVSEWLIYKGLLHGAGRAGGSASAGCAAGAAGLALTGGLVSVAFVRLLATVFLGEARSNRAAGAHESGGSMLAPMAVLGALCGAAGLAPVVAARALEPVLSLTCGGAGTAALQAESAHVLRAIGAVSAAVLVACGAGVVMLRSRAVRSARAGTWDCGYVRPTARMQYGPSGLGQMAVGLFAWALRPRWRRTPIEGPFPAPSSLRSDAPDAVLERGVAPAMRRLARVAARVRLVQRGRIQAYVLYVLLAVIALLLVAGVRP